MISVQNIHGIYNHGGVRRIFPHRIAVLLNGCQGILKQTFLPAMLGIVRPIPVNSANACRSVIRRLRQNNVYVLRRNIVRID